MNTTQNTGIKGFMKKFLGLGERPEGFYLHNHPRTVSKPDSYWAQTPESLQGLNADKLQRAHEFLENRPESLSLLIIRDGELVSEKYFKSAEENQSNNVHSASKAILGILVGIAVDQELIDLDDSISEYLDVPDEKKSLTVRHLLTMTSGYEWEEDETEYEIEDEESWVDAILELDQDDTPGGHFKYCTGDSHLLSAIISEASDQTLEEFAIENLFAPMDIHPTRWNKDPDGYTLGGCNLFLTPRELAKVAQLVLNEGKWEGERLVSKGWIGEMLEDHASVDDSYDFGYHWWLTNFDGEDVCKMWGHGGQFGFVLPERDTIVVLTADTRKDFDELDGDAFMEEYILPVLGG